MSEITIIEGTHQAAKMGVAIRRLLDIAAAHQGDYLVRMPTHRQFDAFSRSVRLADSDARDGQVSKLLRELGSKRREVYLGRGCTLYGDTLRSPAAGRFQAAVLSAPSKLQEVEDLVDQLVEGGHLLIATWIDNRRGTEGRTSGAKWLDGLTRAHRITVHHPDPSIHRQLLELPGHKKAEAYT